MKFIPYGKQDVTPEDIANVVAVLKADFITQGPMIKTFEAQLTKLTGARFASTTSSATTALHLACRALDVGPGDIVWTSPITFVATANSALYCGAHIDFVDIDPKTYNLCPQQLEKKLKLAKQDGRLPKVVIPVHLCGMSCEMEAIYQLAQEYGFKIIEDASHAVGGKYKAKAIGSCQFSDITIFSFHPVKIITTGEGGACLTNNKDLFNQIDLLRSHGITRDESRMPSKSHGPWYYQQIELGYNYRMTDIQAALGTSQISRIHSYISKRNKIANIYNKKLANLPLTLPSITGDHVSSRHLYVIKVDETIRERVFTGLREANIGVNVHYIPVHTQPYYQKMTFLNGPFPNAESYYAQAISLPMYPTITNDEVSYVCDQLTQLLKG